MSNKLRTATRRIGRSVLGATAGVAWVAVLLESLSAAGLRFQAASEGWQVVAGLSAAAVLGAALAWKRRPAERAQAGLYRDRPRRRRLPSFLPPTAAGSCLLLLWLGAMLPAADQPEGPPAAVLRVDRHFAPPPADAGAGQSLIVAGVAEVSADAGWRLDEAAEARLGPGSHAFRSAAADGPAALTWVAVGRGRWPVLRPPAALEVRGDMAALASRLNGRVAGWAAAPEGVPGFAIDRLILDSPPPAAFPPAAEPPARLADAGFKPLADGASDLLGIRPRQYQWAAQPTTTGQKSLGGDADGGDAYGLLVLTVYHGDAWPLGVTAMAPALGVRYADGLPTFYLPTLPAADGGRDVPAGPDLLGESGLTQGAAYLDAAARAWRSRRYAAAGAFVVPAAPRPHRPAAAAQLLYVRRLPAPPPPDGKAGAEPYFPVSPVLAAFALASLAWAGWRVGRP